MAWLKGYSCLVGRSRIYQMAHENAWDYICIFFFVIFPWKKLWHIVESMYSIFVCSSWLLSGFPSNNQWANGIILTSFLPTGASWDDCIQESTASSANKISQQYLHLPFHHHFATFLLGTRPGRGQPTTTSPVVLCCQASLCQVSSGSISLGGPTGGRINHHRTRL